MRDKLVIYYPNVFGLKSQFAVDSATQKAEVTNKIK